MTPNPILEAAVLDALRERITNFLPAQIRSSLEQLTDEQIWWRPNDKSNSVGNLVLHVCGSMRHYLCRGIGGIEYERDRPAEFAERGPVARYQLLAIFDETIRQASQTLEALDPARLTEPAADPGQLSTVFGQLFSVSMHLAAHAGQIVYIAKMLKEGAVDEIWIRALKA